MGWEQRGKARYYYRKVYLPGGKRTSVYCGTGAMGKIAERERELQEELRKAKKRRRDRELARIDAILEKLHTHYERASLATQCKLLTAGWRRDKKNRRRKWQRLKKVA